MEGVHGVMEIVLNIYKRYQQQKIAKCGFALNVINFSIPKTDVGQDL